MNKKPIFEYIRDMRSDLNQMEEKGEIDASFIQKIETLDKEFTSMKQYWIEQKKVSVGSAFVFYSAMHNTNLVLGKMKNRFLNAKKVGNNPKIACDSLLVMPIISEVHQKTTRAIEEKQKMNPFLASDMLKLVSTLRTTAKLVGLLPTPNEEIKTIDNNQLKETATEIDKKFVASNLLNGI
jgi:hypothetical protein